MIPARLCLESAAPCRTGAAVGGDPTPELRIGALEMAARVGGNAVIVHPLAVHHVAHRGSTPFSRLRTPIRIAPNEKGGLF